MVAPGQILAQVPRWDPRIVYYGMGLAGSLLLGAIIIWLVDRWRKKAPQQELYNTGDQLTHFRKLYERGELSAEEFARIRGLLTERMMRELEQSIPEAEAAEPDLPPPPPPRRDNGKSADDQKPDEPPAPPGPPRSEGPPG